MAGRPPALVRAAVLAGEERERWWDRLVSVYPRFAAYQERAADREIPVVRLSPRR